MIPRRLVSGVVRSSQGSSVTMKLTVDELAAPSISE